MTSPDEKKTAGEGGTSVDSALGEDLQFEQIDPAKEKKLLRKLDMAFTPVIMLVYLSCFLDRSNIGNVRTAGMPAAIHASTQQFSTAVSIFYATYVAFETPWAVLLKKLTPRVVITMLCFVWSLVTIFSGFISSVGGLYATRLILGACEGGLFPGLNLYLTMVYKREEQAKRVSYLFVCAALSGAFGGLLAYAILQMNGVSGLAGWRWLYIIEGVLSVLICFVSWFGLPTDPANAWFLNEEEKHIMKVRAAQRAQYMGSEEFSWREVKISLTDPKVYLSGAIQFCQDILLYGFSTFLPSVIKGFKYTTLQSQYLTIPVYLCGAACFLTFALISDRIMKRGLFVLLANFFGIAGYIVLLTAKHRGVQYFGTFLCSIAVYSGPGLNITWLNNNVAGHYRRAAAIGWQQSIGNTAGIVAGQIYRTAPYKLGNAFSLGALGLSQVLVVINWFYLRAQNKEKERIASGAQEDTRKIRDGDRAVDFKYNL